MSPSPPASPSPRRRSRWKQTAALAREFPDLHIQTHLSENHDEIKFTGELYPEAIDYTDIYARYMFYDYADSGSWTEAPTAPTRATSRRSSCASAWRSTWRTAASRRR
jgi:hypothetical protein